MLSLVTVIFDWQVEITSTGRVMVVARSPTNNKYNKSSSFSSSSSLSSSSSSSSIVSLIIVVCKTRIVHVIIGLLLLIVIINNTINISNTTTTLSTISSTLTSAAQHQQQHDDDKVDTTTTTKFGGGSKFNNEATSIILPTTKEASPTTLATTTAESSSSSTNKNKLLLFTNTIFYSKARMDRSGSFIQDMLMSHAYCYHNNLTYGGSCLLLPTDDVEKSISITKVFENENKPHHINLLQNVLGLYPNILYIVNGTCPKDILPSFGETLQSISNKMKEEEQQQEANKKEMSSSTSSTTRMLNRAWYIEYDTKIFTSDYVKYLHNLMMIEQRQRKQPQQQPTASKSSTATTTTTTWTIAVHIRRGDIGPCRPRTRGYNRYLPNSHYLRLIDRYSTPPKGATTTTATTTKVIIYSESESFESFDVFYQRGYDVILDGDIGQVWDGLLHSNVIILSRSSFSLVPAILSLTSNVVVYTPFWHEPLDHWDVVDETFLNQTDVEYKQIKKTQCPEMGLKKKKKKKSREGG